MLKNSILASNSIYVSVSHKKKFLEKYFKILDKIFKKIRSFENGDSIKELNKIPVCHSSFKRLN